MRLRGGCLQRFSFLLFFLCLVLPGVTLYYSNARPLRDATKSTKLDPQETEVTNHEVRSMLSQIEKRAIAFRARIGDLKFAPKKSLIQR